MPDGYWRCRMWRQQMATPWWPKDRSCSCLLACGLHSALVVFTPCPAVRARVADFVFAAAPDRRSGSPSRMRVCDCCGALRSWRLRARLRNAMLPS